MNAMALTETPGSAVTPVPVSRWASATGITAAEDQLALEVPLAILYNQTPYAVMLGSPADLQDFAVGFSITEGLLKQPAELLGFAVEPQPEGLELRLTVADAVIEAVEARARTLPGRTGCGLCGVRALAAAIRYPAPVSRSFTVSSEAIQRALASLSRSQAVYALTGAVHAAAWASPQGDIELVREDVGRHNALDKLLGAVLSRDGAVTNGFVVVSSRASYEMVQKVATCGVELLVAVSAPTALALRVAQSCELTLVAFARSGRHTLYSHPERVRDAF
jgi:FdhD protein